MSDRNDLERLLRYAGKPFNRAGCQFQKCLLGFDCLPDGLFRSEVVRPFKPSGLLLWGCPPGALLESFMIGPDLQIVASYAPVPARFFQAGDSYEQIAKLLDEGKEPPNWCDWSVIEPGQHVRLAITLDGKKLGAAQLIECCMWGTAVCF
jgi:hypothetical protein